MDIKPTFDVREVNRRLQSGHIFIILESEGKTLGWSWAGMGSVFFNEFNCNIYLKPKHSFSYNTYVSKEHRRNRLNHLILNEKLRTLKQLGYEKIWGLIYEWNKPSLKSYINFNFEKIGHYYMLKLFFMNFQFPPKKLME